MALEISGKPKTRIKLADLIQLGADVEVAPDQTIRLRPLTLREMINLFMSEAEAFLGLYAQGVEGKTGTQELLPFLLASPQLVAKIIAFASDEPDQAEAVEKSMPATVQLIALGEIWKLSVPDPKKAQELLSEVMVLSRKLNTLAETQTKTLPFSNAMSPTESNTSSVEAIS
jgi:hypothetical protein